jgi:hypothetical protein
VPEMTEDQLIAQINIIDAEIAKIVSTLGTAGTGALNFVDYQMGNKSVDGSTRMTQLREARAVYQSQLDKVPKVAVADHGYAVDPLTGEDHTEFCGDE